MTITSGTRLYSRAHKGGEIHVDVVGSRALVGRLVKRDGRPSRREAVVSLADVTVIALPLLPPDTAGISRKARPSRRTASEMPCTDSLAAESGSDGSGNTRAHRS